MARADGLLGQGVPSCTRGVAREGGLAVRLSWAEEGGTPSQSRRRLREGGAQGWVGEWVGDGRLAVFLIPASPSLSALLLLGPCTHSDSAVRSAVCLGCFLPFPSLLCPFLPVL